jgi:predicted DNA-binding transcriptional regulator YafY
VVVGYFDERRLLVAFCELRQDFRSFRTDRVIDASFLKETFGEKPSTLRARWRKTLPLRR